MSLALMLAGAGPAAADEGHRDITLDPGKALMEVKVPSQRLYQQLYASYDFVEAMQRNGDGSVSTDVLVNDAERAYLQAQGVQFVRTLENEATTAARVNEREVAARRESRAQNLAENGARSASAIPLPGEVAIQRAYTFTNYAGRFLYVEAHTKAATPITPAGVVGSPTMALSFAGADGVFGAASNMPILRDNENGATPQVNSVNQQTGAITRTDPGGGGFEGFRPPFESEGRHEAFEFSDGNFGLLESALAYSRDVTPPSVNLDSGGVTRATAPPINYRFTWPGEAAVIHYTTDGSTPTLASPTYEAQGPRRPGQILQLDRLGVHDVKWIAVDIKGNQSAVQTQRFIIGPETTVSGTVPPTLSLTIAGPVDLGALTPGVTRTYEAGTMANVISSAGDALLSVSDPSPVATGHLVNDAFSLPQPLQARARNAANTGTAYNNVGSAASPLNLLQYEGPISNDAVSLQFRQAIMANDALRTGAYSKTLTFTLSTTSP